MQTKLTINCAPPGCLYRYSERQCLERSLTLGEFLLKPASSFKDRPGDTARQDDELTRVRHSQPHEVKIVHQRTGRELKPIGPVKFEEKSLTDYLIICFSKKWDRKLFAEFKGSDACLVIHEVEEFQDRIHSAVEKVPPGWIGFDIAVDYEKPHPLGMWFSKPSAYSYQEEWRFAWLPKASFPKLSPTLVTIGSISDIAEIRRKPD